MFSSQSKGTTARTSHMPSRKQGFVRRFITRVSDPKPYLSDNRAGPFSSARAQPHSSPCTSHSVATTARRSTTASHDDVAPTVVGQRLPSEAAGKRFDVEPGRVDQP